MDKAPEAIAALTQLLDFNPTDAEAWAELGDLYLAQGLYAQAIYSLEEILVLLPNAWNVRTTTLAVMSGIDQGLDASSTGRSAPDGSTSQ
jgi:ER membrane protein complex subunit 2